MGIWIIHENQPTPSLSISLLSLYLLSFVYVKNRHFPYPIFSVFLLQITYPYLDVNSSASVRPIDNKTQVYYRLTIDKRNPILESPLKFFWNKIPFKKFVRMDKQCPYPYLDILLKS